MNILKEIKSQHVSIFYTVSGRGNTCNDIN